jgi:hypothetical protein
MELLIHIDTNRSLSMEEAKELDFQSRRKGLPPQELVLNFIREGLRGLKADPSTSSAVAVTTRPAIVDRTREEAAR